MSSADDDRRRFDPRFDPAYQPGYDPRNDPAIAARNTGTRAVSRIDLDSRAASQPPAPIQAPPPLDSTARGRRRAEDVEVIVELDELDGTDDVTADTSSEGGGTNPFHIALWVLSLVLIVAGIVLYRALPGLELSVQASASEPSAQVSYFQLDAAGGISAALIGVGLATAAGALALHAARWRGRSTNRSAD